MASLKDIESVAPLTRQAVWDALCDLEWHIRYCSAFADRNHSRHRMMRVAILLGVIFEGGLLYGGTLNSWVFIPGVIFGLALAGLTVWDATSNYANDAAIFRMVVVLCQRLRVETEELWRDVESGRRSTDQIEEALRAIHEQWAAVVQAIPLGMDDKLNREAAEAANQEISYRYHAELPNLSA